MEKCLACGSAAHVIFFRVDCSNAMCRHYAPQVFKPLSVGSKVKFIAASSETLKGSYPAANWSGWDEFYERLEAEGLPVNKLFFYPGYENEITSGNLAIIREIRGKWFTITEYPFFWAPLSSAVAAT